MMMRESSVTTWGERQSRSRGVEETRDDCYHVSCLRGLRHEERKGKGKGKEDERKRSHDIKLGESYPKVGNRIGNGLMFLVKWLWFQGQRAYWQRQPMIASIQERKLKYKTMLLPSPFPPPLILLHQASPH